jgi:adenine-specific DNA glycosylase
VAVAIVLCAGALLLERRPPKGVLARMWAPPSVEGGRGDLAEAHGVRVGEELAEWRHVFTHRAWTVRAYRCATREPIAPGEDRRLVPIAELERAGVPSAFRPAIEVASALARGCRG